MQGKIKTKIQIFITKKANFLKFSYITGKHYKSEHMIGFMVRTMLIVFSLVTIGSGFQEISSDTLAQWLKGSASSDFILIDLREPLELTTIIGSENCGAYNFPFRTMVFDKAVETFPKDTMIILYCANGTRSKKAASELDLEFSNIYSLIGGINSWKGPTVSGNQIKSPELFPEVMCEPVAVLQPEKCKSSPVTHSMTDKKINLQGRVCKKVSSGMHITTNKRMILIRSKNKLP